MSARPVIRIWPWRYAPQKYRQLSPHGGDEDWVAFVPQELYGFDYRSWMGPGTAFGWARVSEHRLPHGTVYIGAHA